MHSRWRCLAVAVLMCSLEATAAPTQEFWEYMADFSDDNGEVLDPLELDEIVAAREQEVMSEDTATVGDKSSAQTGAVKKAELKTQSSSAPAVSHKGATL